MDNLLNISPAGEIGDSPGGFLLGLEVSLHQDINQRLETPGVNDSLDLCWITGGDVRDGPGALL